MKATLRKPWGETPAGSVVSTEPEEGAVLVGRKRFAYLGLNAFFEPEPKPAKQRTVKLPEVTDPIGGKSAEVTDGE